MKPKSVISLHPQVPLVYECLGMFLAKYFSFLGYCGAKWSKVELI